MSNYLLLRNNKESGPHSLDDLINLGLKPYDLIWIQGKSAAWRYPSEVEELKSIAPVVEEQPFDRFFKKPEPTQDVPATVEQPRPEEPAIKPEYEKYIPKKSVYVTMPGQKTTVAKEPIKQTIPNPPPAQPTISVSENPVAAQIKYSQPLDEIKEMYVKTLHDRKQRIARKSFWLQNLKRTGALASLVAIGLIAGYLIKSNKGSKKDFSLQANAVESQALKSEPRSAPVDTIKKDPLISETAKVTSPSNEQKALHQPTGGFVNKPQHEPKSGDFNRSLDRSIEKSQNKVGLLKETAILPSQGKTNNNQVQGKSNIYQSLIPSQNADVNSLTGERNRKVRNTDFENSNTTSSEKRSVASNEFGGLVTVKSNEYKRVAFGGIRDLQLTVVNESKFVLENVIVELQYIKPNELPLKTENILFSSIAPNATSTIRVPDTNRGIKVNFRIVSIKKKGSDDGVADN